MRPINIWCILQNTTIDSTYSSQTLANTSSSSAFRGRRCVCNSEEVDCLLSAPLLMVWLTDDKILLQPHTGTKQNNGSFVSQRYAEKAWLLFGCAQMKRGQKASFDDGTQRRGKVTRRSGPGNITCFITRKSTTSPKKASLSQIRLAFLTVSPDRHYVSFFGDRSWCRSKRQIPPSAGKHGLCGSRNVS